VVLLHIDQYVIEGTNVPSAIQETNLRDSSSPENIYYQCKLTDFSIIIRVTILSAHFSGLAIYSHHLMSLHYSTTTWKKPHRFLSLNQSLFYITSES